LTLKHVPTALARQSAVESVRRWSAILICSGCYWAPGTDTATCADCIGGSVCRWVGETV